MSLDTMKKAIDFSTSLLLTEGYKGNVIFDFIGGEPLLSIDNIFKAALYVQDIFQNDSKFSGLTYGFRIATNGILYNTPKVQQFIAKFHDVLNVSISIDGNKCKNDLNRVFPDGTGSFDSIIDNVKLWITQFSNALTRITVSSIDLPYLEESVKYLISIGLKRFDISVIVEDVWKDGDDLIFEEQLVGIADYLLVQDIEDKVYISAFEFNIGNPQNLYDAARPCGGMTLAIDGSGNIYNCLRFAKFALNNADARIIGNIFTKFYPNRLRPLSAMDYFLLYPQKCKECDVATGCKICPADCYDNSSTGTIYERTTAICKMHKAKVRAKNYFWNRHQFKHNF